MNDDRLECELRAALLRDEPGPMPAELRRRVNAVPDELSPRRGLVRIPRASRLAASLEAVAAVAVIGAVVAVSLYLRGGDVGPASSARPSATPSGPAPSGSPAATPTPAAPSPGDYAWASLRWSAPSAISGACSINNIVAWHGELIALGATGCPWNPVSAIWHSSDGTTWTVNPDSATFGDRYLADIVATPSRLVAWGGLGWPRPSAGQFTVDTCEAPACGVALLTSADGVSWTPVADTSMFDGAWIRTVTSGAQGLVAIGDIRTVGPAIWVSATGAAWQRLSLSPETFKDADFHDLRATASGYVIAGLVGGVSPGSPAVAAAWWSPDGRTWTKATVQGAGGETSLDYLHAGAHGMVVCNLAGLDRPATAWTSTDGQTWRPKAVSATAGVAAVPSTTISDDGMHMVAVGAGDRLALRMWVSSDGLTWQPLPFSGATGAIPLWWGSTSPTFDRAFVVPGGLVVIGQRDPLLAPSVSVWSVTALP